MDHHLRGGPPLATLEPAQRTRRQVTARFRAAVALSSAALIYTTGNPTDHETRWYRLPASIEGEQILAKLPTPDPRAWFLTLTDVRGATVSTEAQLDAGR
jgi:hypothetical protein